MFGRKPPKQAQPEICNFCGKARTDVTLLIAGTDCAICDACVDVSTDLVADQRAPTPPSTRPDIDTILSRLRAASVVSAESLLLLARALSWQSDASAPRILLVGPTGAGKTTLAKALGTAADRASACIDLNRVTATGYIGEDVENVVHDLVLAAKANIAEAEQGVLVFDGLHHAVVGPRDGRLTRDVSARDVQRHLLRVLGGETTRHLAGPLHPQAPTQLIRTANMCIVLTARLDDPGTDPKAIRDRLRAEGVLGELLARVDLIVPLLQLNVDQLARIIDASAPLILGKPLPAAERDALANAASTHPDGAWLVRQRLMQRALQTDAA